MVDPIFTYVGGIAFLVLIIVPMLYLMVNNPDYEDESPGESVVGGVGVASEASEEEPADEPEEPGAETEEAEEPEAETEETEEVAEEETETEETDEETEFEDAEPQERDDDDDA